MERGGGEEAGEGAGVSNEGAEQTGTASWRAGTAIADASSWGDEPPRRCAVTVAGTASATAAGAIVQHEAASSEAAVVGASVAHASQVIPVADPRSEDIGIGQRSRSPARGAAPVAARESKRRRHVVRRIMVLE